MLIGSDSAGSTLKALLAKDLACDPHVISLADVNSVNHLADDTSYSHIGIKAGQMIARGDADRAVLICGTGIGVAISANKVPGIRATVAHDSFSVERSILSNNCQILTLGQRVIGIELARRLVREWLGYEFDLNSHSTTNIDIITSFEGLQPTQR
jgi:ribose 5-phosphate isomerase B